MWTSTVAGKEAILLVDFKTRLSKSFGQCTTSKIKNCCVLHVFLTCTDLCAFLLSVVVHFFQHLFSCEHGTHCLSPSRLRHNSTLYIGHNCCVLFLFKIAGSSNRQKRLNIAVPRTQPCELRQDHFLKANRLCTLLNSPSFSKPNPNLFQQGK